MWLNKHHTSDVRQMWLKNISHSGYERPNVVGKVTHRTNNQMWFLNFAPRWMTRHTADFDQMWSKNFAPRGGLYPLWTLTKCGS